LNERRGRKRHPAAPDRNSFTSDPRNEGKGRKKREKKRKTRVLEHSHLHSYVGGRKGGGGGKRKRETEKIFFTGRSQKRPL